MRGHSLKRDILTTGTVKHRVHLHSGSVVYWLNRKGIECWVTGLWGIDYWEQGERVYLLLGTVYFYFYRLLHI